MTTAVLNAKITECGNKISDHAKHINTPEFKKLAAENSTARLKQAKLLIKTDFDNKLININRKITSNKAKYLEVQNNLNSLIKKIIILS